MSSPAVRRIAIVAAVLAVASVATSAVVILSRKSTSPAVVARATPSDAGPSMDTSVVAPVDAAPLVDATALLAGPSTPPDAAICDEVSCVLDNYAGACCDRYRPGRRPRPAAGCDEVSCILDNYAKACCDVFRTPRPRPPTPQLPDSLDRTMITAGISRVKPAIIACGDKFPTAKGRVKLKVKVAPDGKITEAEIQDTPDPALGECVVKVARGARFEKTQLGGTFSYPFVF